MCYFIIERQLNIEYIRVVALFVLNKFDLKRQKVCCFGNSFMATECILVQKKGPSKQRARENVYF